MRINYKGVELDFPDDLTTEEINENLLANEEYIQQQTGYDPQWQGPAEEPVATNYVMPSAAPAAPQPFVPKDAVEELMAKEEGGVEALQKYETRKQELRDKGVEEGELDQRISTLQDQDDRDNAALVAEIGSELLMMGIPGGQIRMLQKAPAAMRYLASIGRGGLESASAGIIGNLVAGREWDEGIATDAAWGAGGNAVAGAFGRQVLADPSKQQVRRYADDLVAEGRQVDQAATTLRAERNLDTFVDEASRGGYVRVADDAAESRKLMKDRGLDVDEMASGLVREGDYVRVGRELGETIKEPAVREGMKAARAKSVGDAIRQLDTPTMAAARQLDEVGALKSLVVDVPVKGGIRNAMSKLEKATDVGIISSLRKGVRKGVEEALPTKLVDDLSSHLDKFKAFDGNYVQTLKKQESTLKGQSKVLESTPVKSADTVEQYFKVQDDLLKVQKDLKDIVGIMKDKSALESVIQQIEKGGKVSEKSIEKVADLGSKLADKRLLDDVASLRSMTPKKVEEAASTGKQLGSAALAYFTGGLSAMGQAGLMATNTIGQRQSRNALKKAHDLFKEFRAGRMTEEAMIKAIDDMPTETKRELIISLMVRSGGEMEGTEE